ncbi:hypothetical protein [Candidatus Galacturonibacter soehngenii]|nr:hypothetical protein [Candidatus Galacturonibacter soehngenii]
MSASQPLDFLPIPTLRVVALELCSIANLSGEIKCLLRSRLISFR